jgi:UDP-glucose 4-epimerase
MSEDHPQVPINPYGATKLVFERALADYASAGALRAVALRYFNAAGCHPDGTLGEDHHPEEHIIPRAIAAAYGNGDGLKIYGDDYETPDGTCVRDYVHVQDLARAHIAALASDRGPFRAYNLGTGRGHSVREVIESVARVTGRQVPAEIGPRRRGDPPVLVAAAERARAELGFDPEWRDLDALVATSVRWMRDHPRGYARA